MKNKFKYIKLDIPKNEYELLKLITKKDVYFLYDSLNHKKLKEKINEAMKNSDINNPLYFGKEFKIFGLQDFAMYFPELYHEFKMERVGKLREITFDSNGRVNKIRIGNKRARTFYLEDFGQSVFPIITNYYEINYSIK